MLKQKHIFFTFLLITLQSKIQPNEPIKTPEHILLHNYLLLTSKAAWLRSTNYGICASRISNYIGDYYDGADEQAPKNLNKLSFAQKKQILTNIGRESHQYPYGIIQIVFDKQAEFKPGQLYESKSPYEMMLNLHLYFGLKIGHLKNQTKESIWSMPLKEKAKLFDQLSKETQYEIHQQWMHFIAHELI